MTIKKSAVHLAVILMAGLAAGGAVHGLRDPLVRVARGANVYAQYGDDGILPGGGQVAMPEEFSSGPGGVKYVQVELDIKNDEQRGKSYYCSEAPNTGILVFVFQGQNYVYIHCVTSAEAAGKLGHKAVYTFDDANFGYGGGSGWWMQFSSQGSFNADVYGANGADGGFYPYLVLADDKGAGSPASVSDMAQYSADAYAEDPSTSTLPENGVVRGNAVAFAGAPSSFFDGDAVRLEVEVRPSSIPFSGVRTAMSEEVSSGATTSVVVDKLRPGSYHWAARAADPSRGDLSQWVEYGAAGNTDFIVATSSVREPVVIVPGIMGSRLKNASSGVEVWPNVNKMVREKSDSYLDYLKMDPDGAPQAAKPVAVGNMLLAATTTFLGVPISAHIYDRLIDAFASAGYKEGKDLYVVPYDWRLGIESSSAALAAVIDEAVAASGDGMVNIVAHSMGGLLVKNYLIAHPDPAWLDNLVMVGVPELGSPKAWKLVNYGDDMGMSWLGIGLNQNEAKAISENMLSAYELMPSRRYVDISGGYVRDFRGGGSKVLGYDDLGGPNGPLSVAADLFHRGMDGIPVNASRVYNIVGCLEPTPVEYDLYDGGLIDIKRAEGDGTVPAASAMNLADGFRNFFVRGDVTGIDHAGLVRDDRPLALIRDIVENGGYDATDGGGSIDLPEGISAYLADCVSPRAEGEGGLKVTTIEFSSHGSGGALDVYDQTGSHTGITADGDIEIGIPSSSYDVIGDNIFATLPALAAGGAYDVVDRAGATSSASGTSIGEFKIKEYDAVGRIAQSATYLFPPDIPVSSTAGMHFEGFGGDLALSVAGSGANATDTVLLPVSMAVLPSSTGDAAPPEISLPSVSSTVQLGSTTTLSFGASDEGSGVALIAASLNGIPVADGDTVTFDKSGANVFSLTAVDGVGNPRTATIAFDVVGDAPAVAAVTDGGGGGGGGGGVGGGSSVQVTASTQYAGRGEVLGASTSTGADIETESSSEAIAIAAETATATSTLSMGELRSRLISLERELIALQLKSPACAPIFGSNLREGDGGGDVLLLQRALNSSVLTQVAVYGPGSPGNETAFFGPATASAVAAFQEIFADDILAPAGLSAGNGFAGPATRAKLNSLCGG